MRLPLTKAPLDELRSTRKPVQALIGTIMNASQGEVSKIEQRTDVHRIASVVSVDAMIPASEATDVQED